MKLNKKEYKCSEFINYFFQSNYYRKTFFKCGKGVASHDNFGRWVLPLEELNNFIIYTPKSKEEELFVPY